jgi:hypothetical protein
LEVLKNEALSPEFLAQVEQTEAAGKDAVALRVFAHRPDMMLGYMGWYYGAHSGGILPITLKEIVRLRIAQLNDCNT